MISRRELLGSCASLELSRPALAQPTASRVLRFVPQVAYSVPDPVWTTAIVVVTHALMVYDGRWRGFVRYPHTGAFDSGAGLGGRAVGRQIERQRRGRLAEVEFVAAEAVEILVQVGAGAGQGFGRDRGAVPVSLEAVERVGHADDGVEDEQVGDEVVVLDHLALHVARGGGRQAAAAEGDPLGVSVEQLAFVGDTDGAAQVSRSEVAKQEVRADCAAQLPEGEVDPVLATVGSKPAQDGPVTS